ncbi:MAG TPA: hypothetical protein VEA80_01760 [Vitreimonas sp.]|uniref:hypothetical protein n=1 Tax=Vitreimonas sp. TaxID=3069702 RepID=UPI002D51882E|nr:hypothetical protein [Vitreimonas sp.]HYD86176.1 hypothetical protein [Vitreimonas sp.]
MRLLIVLLACVAACGEPTSAPPPTVEKMPNAAQGSDESSAVVIEPPAGIEPEVFTDTDSSPLTADEIVGMWGLRANCGQPTVFGADGTLTDYTGQTGRWSLSGNSLTITQGSQAHTNEVNQLNANAFTSAAPEDGSGRTRLFLIYRRC